jgi:hypothetical protein
VAADARVQCVRRERQLGAHVGFHIAQQEILKVGVSFERYARPLSNRAVRAVASDEIPHANVLRPAVTVPEQTIDSIHVRLEAHELHATLDRHSVRGDVVAEQLLRFRL